MRKYDYSEYKKKKKKKENRSEFYKSEHNF